MITALFHPPVRWVPGVKRPGRGVDHPPTSSAEVKERVEPYFYSPSGPSRPVLVDQPPTSSAEVKERVELYLYSPHSEPSRPVFFDHQPTSSAEVKERVELYLYSPHSGPSRPVFFDHPPTSSAEVKERVEFYLYSPFWAFVACSGVSFTFTFTFTFRSRCNLPTFWGYLSVPSSGFVPKTSVTDCHNSLRNDPEEHSSRTAGKMWNGFVWLGNWREMTGCCEDGNEHSCAISFGEFIDWLRAISFSKTKGSSACG